MQLIIPVVPATLDFIEELNGGTRPKIGESPTFFVYFGQDTPPEIINYRFWAQMYDNVDYNTVSISFRK